MTEPTERDRELFAKELRINKEPELAEMVVAGEANGVISLAALRAIAAAREEGRREALVWRDPATWRLGEDCLIACHGIPIGNEAPRHPQVSQHYGMASLPAGTVGWMPLPKWNQAP